MWPFRCQHPANRLSVRKAQTVANIDADFDRVTYHLSCGACGENIEVSYAAMIGGVGAFIARGIKKSDVGYTP
jgi:hypothetical protein